MTSILAMVILMLTLIPTDVENKHDSTYLLFTRTPFVKGRVINWIVEV